MIGKTQRVIDANFNRAREGLRVCEDIARFLMDSPSLTRRFKAARHGISGIVGGLERSTYLELTGFRDSINDVGRASGKKSEMRRRSISDIFIANIERSKESVRVLEEFFKLIDAKKAAALSRIRFSLYDIERDAAGKIAALNKDIRTR